MRGERRQGRRDECVPSSGRRQADHRRLLLHLGAAADDGSAGVAAEALELDLDLAPEQRRELGVVDRIVHVREHQVLPDEHSELIARRVEHVVLVDAGARHADHVEPRVAQLDEPLPDAVRWRSECHGVDRRPERAAAEDGNAGDRERQAVVAGTVDARVDRAEANAPVSDADATSVVEHELDVDGVEGRVAVRVRQPGRGTRHP